MPHERLRLDRDPFLPRPSQLPWRERGLWPASWIDDGSTATTPWVALFRLDFTAETSASAILHISADERYEICLDGEMLGRGPERGSPERWYFETYQLNLAPGPHRLVARVWALGGQAPDAQMSVRPGFLLAAEGEWETRLSTGLAPWTCRQAQGLKFYDPPLAHWKGATVEIDGATFDWDWQKGPGDGWRPARAWARARGLRIDWELPPHHRMAPAPLPPLLCRPVPSARLAHLDSPPTADTASYPVLAQQHLASEAADWEAWAARGEPVLVPARSRRRAILALPDYFCAFPRLTLARGRGASVRLHWAEALFEDARRKGRRDVIEGKRFIGQGDRFLPAGGSSPRNYEPLWWSAGRYIEIFIETADEPLSLGRLDLLETRLPLEMESRFTADDPRLNRIVPLMVRGLQVCSHDTYFDCPYYEEMQYAADARLEALAAAVMQRDPALSRKAIDVFDLSRLPSGLPQSRFPCRILQTIPAWSLWWVVMVNEHAYWRDDLASVRRWLPGVRSTLEGFTQWLGEDGLLGAPEGWNFFDWVPEWAEEDGCPPGSIEGATAPLHWLWVHALQHGADLEEQLGDADLAKRFRTLAARLARRGLEAYWHEGRGLLADDLGLSRFSEHTQSLALLTGLLPDAAKRRVLDGLLTAPDLARATVSYSHVLFEALRATDRADAIFPRLDLWMGLADLGFVTPIESPEPSRSDCHGWGAHPLFHYFATFLGIRPGAPGFRAVDIRPQPGPLRWLEGSLVHPGGGAVDLSLRRTDSGRWSGRVRLPAGIPGLLHLNGEDIPLAPGEAREF